MSEMTSLTCRTAFAFIKKIQSKWTEKYMGDVAWSRKPFGLPTNYFQINPEFNKNDSKSIPCLSRRRLIKYASIDHITQNKDKLGLWKVCIPAAFSGSKGKRRSTLPPHQIFLVDKGVITTETYSIIDVFNDKEKAENLISYLQTDFSRYLLGLRKLTQHIPKDRWNWVPYMDVNRQWTDEDLFEYFEITPEEQTHIKNKVKEWT